MKCLSENNLALGIPKAIYILYVTNFVLKNFIKQKPLIFEKFYIFRRPKFRQIQTVLLLFESK